MATEEHVAHCFDTLLSHFQKREPGAPRFPNDKYPLFVTWNKVNRRQEHELRGCKGTFTPQELHRGIPEYSLISALKDTRFSPIPQDEVPSLHCGVSLLTNFETVGNVWDWEVGTHGILIDFVDPQGATRGATYLPEVMPEQGWDRAEALHSLVRKSGWKGAITDTLYQAMKLTRYQSSKSALHYADYLEAFAHK